MNKTEIYGVGTNFHPTEDLFSPSKLSQRDDKSHQTDKRDAAQTRWRGGGGAWLICHLSERCVALTSDRI
jgi:hypothetical protein